MLPSSTRIFVYAQPIDMRRSFDALGQCVRDVLKQDPQSGALFIFAGKRRERTTFYIQNERGHGSVPLASIAREACCDHAPRPGRRSRGRPHRARPKYFP